MTPGLLQTPPAPCLRPVTFNGNTLTCQKPTKHQGPCDHRNRDARGETPNNTNNEPQPITLANIRTASAKVDALTATDRGYQRSINDTRIKYLLTLIDTATAALTDPPTHT